MGLTAKSASVANPGSSEGPPFISNASAYSIGGNGALTPVPGSPFAAGTFPTSVAVDPTAKFAYVTNAFSNNVSAYSIGANGALKPVPGSPFAAGTEPTSVAVTPPATFASSFDSRHTTEPRFEMKHYVPLKPIADWTNPLAVNVTLQIGTFSVTIPAGSFEQKPNGRFDFKGVINDV